MAVKLIVVISTFLSMTTMISNATWDAQAILAYVSMKPFNNLDPLEKKERKIY